MKLPRDVRLGPPPTRLRQGVPLLVALLLGLVCSLPAVGAARPAGAPPAPTAGSTGSTLVRDTILDRGTARRTLARAARWGGPYTAVTGEAVTVYLSDTYPQDPAVGQSWADFLAGLVHGSELATVTAYLAPPTEVGSICGFSALACYSPDERMIVAPGENAVPEVSARGILTHEYGHHVAANRSNAPWTALDSGTKRWASRIGVCARTRLGELHPGASDRPQYALNPGEGFAEAYRVMNERRAGATESTWDVVSPVFYPDASALAALEQDVLQPWSAATTVTRAGQVGPRANRRNYAVATPLDGTLRATLRAPARTRLTLELYAGSARLGRAAVAAGRSATVTTTVCGKRSFRVRVGRLTGAGTFRLTVSRP